MVAAAAISLISYGSRTAFAWKPGRGRNEEFPVNGRIRERVCGRDQPETRPQKAPKYLYPGREDDGQNTVCCAEKPQVCREFAAAGPIGDGLSGSVAVLSV